MTLWNAANEIEELSHKLSNVRDAVELIAEGVDSPYSGALWVVYAVIDDLQDRMYVQSEMVMNLHRAESKKAKK